MAHTPRGPYNQISAKKPDWISKNLSWNNIHLDQVFDTTPMLKKNHEIRISDPIIIKPWKWKSKERLSESTFPSVHDASNFSDKNLQS